MFLMQEKTKTYKQLFPYSCMGLFGRGKKRDNVVDLSERYKRQQEKLAGVRKEQQAQKESSGFSFLSNLASGSASASSESSIPSVSSDNAGERKKKLASKLMEITNKLEDLSNQIYHLQQRVDLLERKAG